MQIESVAVNQPGQNRINHTVIRIALLFLLKVVYTLQYNEKRKGEQENGECVVVISDHGDRNYFFLLNFCEQNGFPFSLV